MTHHTERRADCPFCDPPDTHGHLYQNSTTKAWICFKCGRTGKGALSVSWYGGGTRIDIERDLPHETLTDDWYEPLNTAKHLRAAAYLLKHHVPYYVARHYKVGVSRRSHLVLPVFHPTRSDHLLFFQLRSLQKKSFRSFGQRAAVLPLFDLTEHATGRLVVVESIVSAMRLSPHAPTVALCGKLVSQWQLNALRGMAWRRRLFIWLDTDAQAQTLKLVTNLREWAYMIVPIKTADYEQTGVDPCDVNDENVKRLLNRGDKV